MRVGAGKSCGSTKIAFPPNGVDLRRNKNNECKTEYTPFNVAYETTGTNTCGNVNIVEGKYAKPLTIAAANNVLIMKQRRKNERRRHARADRHQLHPGLPPGRTGAPDGNATGTGGTAPKTSASPNAKATRDRLDRKPENRSRPPGTAAFLHR